MEDEPTNPFVEKNAPKIGPHQPVTQQPEHHGVETPERTERKQKRFIRTLKIGLPLLGIVLLVGYLLLTIAL